MIQNNTPFINDWIFRKDGFHYALIHTLTGDVVPLDIGRGDFGLGMKSLTLKNPAYHTLLHDFLQSDLGTASERQYYHGDTRAFLVAVLDYTFHYKK